MSLVQNDRSGSAVGWKARSLYEELQALTPSDAAPTSDLDRVLDLLEKKRPAYSLASLEDHREAVPALKAELDRLQAKARARAAAESEAAGSELKPGEQGSLRTVPAADLNRVLGDPILVKAVIPALLQTRDGCSTELLTELLTKSISPGRLLYGWEVLAGHYPKPALEAALKRAGSALTAGKDRSGGKPPQAASKPPQANGEPAPADGEPAPAANPAESGTGKADTGFPRFNTLLLCQPLLELLTAENFYEALLQASRKRMPATDNSTVAEAPLIRQTEAGTDPALATAAESDDRFDSGAARMLPQPGYRFDPVAFLTFCQDLLLNPDSRLGKRLCIDLLLAADLLSLRKTRSFWLPALEAAPPEKLAHLLTRLSASSALPSGSRAQLCRDILAPVYRDEKLKKALSAALPTDQRRNIRRQISLFNIREHFSANPVKYRFFMERFNHILRAVKVDGATLILRFHDFYLVDSLDQPDSSLLWSREYFDRQMELNLDSNYFINPPFPVGELKATAVNAPFTQPESLVRLSFVEPGYSLTQRWFAARLGQPLGQPESHQT